MKKKVLVTQPWDKSFVPLFDSFVKELEEKDVEVIVDTNDKTSLTEEEVLERAQGLFAHICGTDTWSAKAIDKADQLKIISRIGVGYDTIDIPYATQKGIVVTTTPGAGAETVAEQAYSMMIAIARQLNKGDRLVKEGFWGRVYALSLYRKTLGIIGLGLIGKQLSRIVKGFDMNIIAYDPYPDVQFAKENNIRLVELDELLTKSDFISLHLPKSPQTVDLISKRELAMMKKTAIIVNCARGGIINELDLYNALKNEQIFGAGLDVFVNEPINMDNPLLTLNNVVLMPHNAGTTDEGKNKVVGAAFRNVIEFIDGKVPHGIKNPEVLK